jgi:hypothetical protein
MQKSLKMAFKCQFPAFSQVLPSPSDRLTALVAGRQKTTNLSLPDNDNFYDEK